MGLDYDLYVIDPSNRYASMYQLRGCLKDAIDELAERTASLSERLNKLENEAAVADNNVLDKEPYIKDEKVRKALKTWLVANGFRDDIECHTLTAGTRFSCGNYCIEFLGFFIYDLIRGQKYCIEELCGVDDD